MANVLGLAVVGWVTLVHFNFEDQSKNLMEAINRSTATTAGTDGLVNWSLKHYFDDQVISQHLLLLRNPMKLLRDGSNQRTTKSDLRSDGGKYGYNEGTQ